ncbi:MAG: MBL fold metallo-hydrolase [Nanoarchaeota archaeon]
MIKLAPNVWKINVDSNVYYLDLAEKIIIDTGSRSDQETVKEEIEQVVQLDKVDKVILTHIHYDHAGNVDLFPHATVFASYQEIEDFKKNPLVSFNLNPKIILYLIKKLEDINKIQKFLSKNQIEMINVPGHTRGSIALFYKKERILFSGDCLFENGIGRCDLPNSAASEMDNSLEKLDKIDYKILAPGHDY